MVLFRFFNDSKKSKRQPAKRLFDEDGKDGVNDFSQVIGLCSGKFEDDNCVSGVDGTISKSKGVDGMYLKDNDFSITQVIGLCSGKFSDDDGVTSTQIDPTSKMNRGCDENDEESLSNPPMEHPFTSRMVDIDKPSNKLINFGNESQFTNTAEGIFSLGVTNDMMQPDLDKPLGLSDIIDDNFDDNAIDFCSASFSGEVTDKDGSKEDARQKLIKNSNIYFYIQLYYTFISHIDLS